MVVNKLDDNKMIVMKRSLIKAAAFLTGVSVLLCISGSGAAIYAQTESTQKLTFSWKRTPLTGERTGVTFPFADNVEESLGTVSKRGVYTAPDGRVFKANTATAKAAEVMISAQPAMAYVKGTIVGYSTREMVRSYPESEISNWFIDTIMGAVAELSGKKVDVGIGNFGGIRCDMPKGEILLDDLKSMFPFKNQVVYVEMPGSELLAVLDYMAATKFQVLGGVRVVAENGKIISAEIDGCPISPDRNYGLATISFLLDGGDNLFLSRNAKNVEIFDLDIIDIILEDVAARRAAGKPIEYNTDGRVKIL